MSRFFSGMKNWVFTIVLISCNILVSFSQNWPKIYGYSTNTWCNGLIESYDHGYIICSQVDAGYQVPHMKSWIIKTDINGNILWTKNIASSSYEIVFFGISATSDGGFILIGETTKLDSANNDVVIMKLNACGESQWCKIFLTQGNDDYGFKIKQVGNNFIALVDYFQQWTTRRIWLFKLDFNGNVIWQKLVNQSTSSTFGAQGYDLLVASNGDYIVNADVYDGTPGPPYILRPLTIRTDSNGNNIWSVPFGRSFNYIGSVPRYANENQSGSFYIAARHNIDSSALYTRVPCFFKVKSDGQDLYYRDLIPNANLGGALTLNLTNNNTLFISAGWKTGSNDTIAILKSDTLGNIFQKQVLFLNLNGSIYESLFTFDSKYLASGSFSPSGGTYKLYLYKFNLNLDYDSVYTIPKTYDSLCPHPIVSSNLNLDGCGVITDIRDPINNPEKCKLKLFPNPATDHLTVLFPKYLEKQSSNGATSTTTIFHQWQVLTLEIYALDGSLIFKQEISKDQEQLGLDVSNWKRGMYYFRLLYCGEMVSGEKIIFR